MRRVLAWAACCGAVLWQGARVAAQNSTDAAPEINSSILVVGPGDYVAQSGGTSRCEQMVDRAAAITQSRLMFTPTLFWVDNSYKDRKSVNSQGNVTYYCYNRQPGNGQSTPSVCSEATPADQQLFQQSMQRCFQRAVDKGLSIAIAPHLDDGLGFGGWRNGLRFDPLVQYGAMSYADFFLYPLADALNAVLTPSTQVLFAMQGEMSATVMYYPASYLKLVPLLRDRVLQGKPSSYRGNVRVGVSTNFDKLCACVLQDLVDTNQYLQLFPAAIAPQLGQFDTSSLAALYDAVDFIGVSSYPSLAPNFGLHEIESATYQFATEISYFGVNISDLVLNKGKPLYWNEAGVGGGISQDGQTRATTAAQAAGTPFFGVFGGYDPSTDPWAIPAVRDYNHYFFNQLAAYLDSRGHCEGCQYRCDGVFLWNDASWDIEGIYPESNNAKGSYRDDAIVALINAHNAKGVAAAHSEAQQGSPSSPALTVQSFPPGTPGLAAGAPVPVPQPAAGASRWDLPPVYPHVSPPPGPPPSPAPAQQSQPLLGSQSDSPAAAPPTQYPQDPAHNAKYALSPYTHISPQELSPAAAPLAPAPSPAAAAPSPAATAPSPAAAAPPTTAPSPAATDPSPAAAPDPSTLSRPQGVVQQAPVPWPAPATTSPGQSGRDSRWDLPPVYPHASPLPWPPPAADAPLAPAAPATYIRAPLKAALAGAQAPLGPSPLETSQKVDLTRRLGPSAAIPAELQGAQAFYAQGQPSQGPAPPPGQQVVGGRRRRGT